MKTKLFGLLTLPVLMLIVVSCDNDAEGNKSVPDAEPIVLKSEFETKTVNNRSFAIDLFKATVAESGGENLFISPYSVNTALGMLWNGATGVSDAEL